MEYVKFIFSVLGNIFVNPAAAYRRLQGRPAAWFPLLLIAISWIVFWNWFYHSVDFPWVIERLVATETAAAAPDERGELAANISRLQPGALIVISVFVTLAILLISALVESIYLLVVGAVFDDKPGFKEWFSLTMWAGMTNVVAIALMALHFTFDEHGRLTAEQLNPLTLDNLFFHVPDGSPFKRLLDSVDVTLLWSQALMIVGYHEWTRRSWLQSIAIVSAPFVAVYGIWAIVVALR